MAKKESKKEPAAENHGAAIRPENKNTGEGTGLPDAKPAASKKLKFYSKFLNFTFSVTAVDKDGKPKIQRNNFGQPVYDGNGNEQPIHIAVKFRALEVRASKGYLSFYEFDPSDIAPQNALIGKELLKLAADASVNVQDEDTHDRTTNSAMYTEKKRRQELEDENARLNAALSSPEELRKRLAELSKE